MLLCKGGPIRWTIQGGGDEDCRQQIAVRYRVHHQECLVVVVVVMREAEVHPVQLLSQSAVHHYQHLLRGTIQRLHPSHPSVYDNIQW